MLKSANGFIRQGCVQDIGSYGRILQIDSTQVTGLIALPVAKQLGLSIAEVNMQTSATALISSHIRQVPVALALCHALISPPIHAADLME